MLISMQDVETIVTPRTRSYFFNEIDGLANNDGLLIVASTNFLGMKQLFEKCGS